MNGSYTNYPDSLESENSYTEFDSNLSASNTFSDDSLDYKSKNKKEQEVVRSCENVNVGDENPLDYLEREVFTVLLPCFEDMLFAAKENKALKVQKSTFNGIDHLAELLWNRNPNHPERQKSYVSIFDIPFAETWLQSNPRPIYPKSWLWTPTEAAIVIQSAVRGYFVRRTPEVQELRQFWKAIATEKLKGQKMI